MDLQNYHFSQATFEFDLGLYSTRPCNREFVTLVDSNNTMFPKGIELNFNVDIQVEAGGLINESDF